MEMELLPIPLPRSLTVMIASLRVEGIMPPILAELALRGPLRVLDGGNRFPVQRLLALLRAQRADPTEAARGITVQRAFTCHQVLALLETTPALPQPTVLLDPLSSFYDDNVPLPEAERVLAACIAHVRRLRQVAGVLAFVKRAEMPERLPLFERFCADAGNLLELMPEAARAVQPGLF